MDEDYDDGNGLANIIGDEGMHNLENILEA